MDSRTSSPTSLERAYLDRDKVNREMRRRQERLREQQRLMVRRFVDDHQGRMKKLQARVDTTEAALTERARDSRRWRRRAWRGLFWSLLALAAGAWLLLQEQALRQRSGGHDAALASAEARAGTLQQELHTVRETLAGQHWAAARQGLAGGEHLLASHHFLQAALSEPDPARAANARLAAREMLGGVGLDRALSLGQPVREARLLEGQRLLVWGGDSLRLWELANPRPHGPALHHSAPVLGVVEDYPRALAWSTREARLWDLSDAKSLASFAPGGELHGATLLDDGGVLTWDADGRLDWWRADGERLESYRHPGAVLGVSVAGRYGWLLSWSWQPLAEDRSLLVVHRLDGDGPLLRLLVPGRLTGATLSPDGRYLLGWGHDGRVRLWNAASGELLRILETQQDWIHGGRFVNGQLLTWSDDTSARLWQPGADAELGRGLPHQAAVLGALAAPDGTRLLTWSADHRARLWDARDGLALSAPLSHQGPLRGAAFDSDGRELLTWSEDGSARLWRATDGQALAPPLRHPAPVVAAGFSADGRLFSVDQTGGLRLWQRQSRAASASGDDPAGEVLNPAPDPDGRLTLGDGQPTLPAGIRHAPWMRGARLNTDSGRLLVWGGDLFDGRAALWDTRSGAALTPPLAHDDRVAGAVFHPDGRRFLTWTDHGSLQRWSGRGRAQGAPLQPRQRILGARYSPDGEQLLSWHGDGTVQLWDAHRLTPLLPARPLAGGVRRAFFAEPDRLVIEPLLGPTRGWRLRAVPDLPGPLASAWLEVATGTSLHEAGELRVLGSGDWLVRTEALPVDPTQLAGVLPASNSASSKR